MRDTRLTIVRLLSNMASAREIQLYLKRFSQVDASRFAVVRVGGVVLRDHMGPLVSSLAFLQEVGLTPVVVHGARPQIEAEMALLGLEVREDEGVPHTSAEGLAVVRRVLQRENLRLVEALQAAGVRGTAFHGGVFECDWLARRRHGFVGRVRRVHTAEVEAAIGVGSIPVIASLGETAGGQILRLDPDAAADGLITRLEPYKIILLTPTGGLLDPRGKLIDSINLSTEYEALRTAPWVDEAMRAELARIHHLLMKLPPSSSLSITRPEELARELFTHRGSGTLVRRGEQIARHDGWKGVDPLRLRALIESSFGKTLAADYFERARPFRVYRSEHYRAAIVLDRPADDLVYMDKFAVTDEAQGEGLGRAIWQEMRAETPRLFWRSRRGNKVNEFYFANADGAVKDDTWTVFWYGMDGWERIRAAVEHARSRPVTVG